MALKRNSLRVTYLGCLQFRITSLMFQKGFPKSIDQNKNLISLLSVLQIVFNDCDVCMYVCISCVLMSYHLHISSSFTMLNNSRWDMTRFNTVGSYLYSIGALCDHSETM